MKSNNRPQIHIHAPKAWKPQSTEHFGHWLAGLIDADGYIHKRDSIVEIAFHQKDVSAAYYVKKRVGLGTIRKRKGEKCYIYSSKIGGAKVIADLIHNKLRHETKIEQFNKVFVPTFGLTPTIQPTSGLLTNHWLAGFIMGDGSFQITIRDRPDRPNKQISITLQVSQKKRDLLDTIHSVFGGSITHRKKTDIYYYSSVSFENVVKVIKYLDEYQVMSTALTTYWLWRKAYLLVQSNEHLTAAGQEEIEALKKRISKLRAR